MSRATTAISQHLHRQCEGSSYAEHCLQLLGMTCASSHIHTLTQSLNTLSGRRDQNLEERINHMAIYRNAFVCRGVLSSQRLLIF